MSATSAAQIHRHAVVTGASGMLGAALAQRLLDSDWHVDLWSRNMSERTDQLLAEYPERARWHAVDLTDPGTIKQAA
ncbi:SDR family NAD(P)-dependent oxidoreductase [Brevibacterium sp. HMSC07C04]|uniref:SDR family NAD(P)-dependent oxidoreductase n=1 Tax=Brevibacterium sp. HMSC07C04 TaxID=1581130 RepID=UPI001C40426E|nr:SDR family NAD(P)-dependent oxidoreductase [Brevibacterium sp. HMSC07C04]